MGKKLTKISTGEGKRKGRAGCSSSTSYACRLKKILEMMEVKIKMKIAELEGTLSCIMTLKG